MVDTVQQQREEASYKSYNLLEQPTYLRFVIRMKSQEIPLFETTGAMTKVDRF